MDIRNHSKFVFPNIYCQDKIILYISIVFGFLMILYYWYVILVVNVPMDIQLHVEYVAQKVCIERQSFPAHPGFYYIVWLLSGFACDYNIIIKVAIVLMGVFWGICVYLSTYTGIFLVDFHAKEKLVYFNNLNYVPVLSAAVLSCLVYPVPAFKYYNFVGLLPSNLYSNSTWICGLPFSVVIFGLGVYQIKVNYKNLACETTRSTHKFGNLTEIPSMFERIQYKLPL